MNFATKAFQNKSIVSNIFSFLGNNCAQHSFIKRPNKQLLIYGQVQSGKTAKIINYITTNTNRVKILLIQNSLSMLYQYEISLRKNNIKYYSVCKNNISFVKQCISNNSIKNIVLIVMNNIHRRTALDMIVERRKINYSLIMDESDLYHDIIKHSNIYKKAKECVHVTATPFIRSYKRYFDDVDIISPKKEYFGLNKLDTKFIPNVECEYKTTTNIIDEEFLQTSQGIMLINIHTRLENMQNMARYLSNKANLLKIPIVMLSSKNVLYYNKKIKELQKMSVSEIISGLESHSHIIFIANRLSTRGINYSNLTYTRHLTHQIINKTLSKTNFIQRCRILGNKPNTDKLKLYCLRCDEDYFNNIMKKVEAISKNGGAEFKLS